MLKKNWHEEWMLNSVAWLCAICHRFVHECATNEELARDWWSVKKLMGREDVMTWTKWRGSIRWKKRWGEVYGGRRNEECKVWCLAKWVIDRRIQDWTRTAPVMFASHLSFAPAFTSRGKSYLLDPHIMVVDRRQKMPQEAPFRGPRRRIRRMKTLHYTDKPFQCWSQGRWSRNLAYRICEILWSLCGLRRTPYAKSPVLLICFTGRATVAFEAINHFFASHIFLLILQLRSKCLI